MLQLQRVPEFCFQHVTSSPLYAQSNAKAEKGVHIVKQLLRKAKDSNSDLYLSLLSYRASPLEHGMSRAQLLMGRKLHTTLPHMGEPEKYKQVRQKQKHLRRRQKINYDKSSRSLVPLVPHDIVRVEGSNSWSKKATVMEEVSPRSYTVRTEDGQILRRNRRSLLKTKETFEEQEQLQGESPACTASAEVTSAAEAPPVLEDGGAAEQVHSTPVLRRSARNIKAPDRLNL